MASRHCQQENDEGNVKRTRLGNCFQPAPLGQGLASNGGKRVDSNHDSGLKVMEGRERQTIPGPVTRRPP